MGSKRTEPPAAGDCAAVGGAVTTACGATGRLGLTGTEFRPEGVRERDAGVDAARTQAGQFHSPMTGTATPSCCAEKDPEHVLHRISVASSSSMVTPSSSQRAGSRCAK